MIFLNQRYFAPFISDNYEKKEKEMEAFRMEICTTLIGFLQLLVFAAVVFDSFDLKTHGLFLVRYVSYCVYELNKLHLK